MYMNVTWCNQRVEKKKMTAVAINWYIYKNTKKGNNKNNTNDKIGNNNNLKF